MAGGAFLRSLQGIRACYRADGWPEVIWCEFPLYQAFSFSAAHKAQLTRSQNSTLSVLPIISTSLLGVSEAATSGADRLAIGRGHLITSGDGIAMVRLTRSGGGDVSLWRLECDGLTAEVPWHAQREELLLPIIDSGDLGAALKLTAIGEYAERMSVNAAVVTDLDLGSAVEGTLLAGPSLASGRSRMSTQSVAFADFAVERHTGVMLEIEFGSWKGRVELRALAKTGESMEWQARATGATTVALDLSGLLGETLVQFDVTAIDGPAQWTVLTALVAQQLKTPQ